MRSLMAIVSDKVSWNTKASDYVLCYKGLDRLSGDEGHRLCLNPLGE